MESIQLHTKIEIFKSPEEKNLIPPDYKKKIPQRSRIHRILKRIQSHSLDYVQESNASMDEFATNSR